MGARREDGPDAGDEAFPLPPRLAAILADLPVARLAFVPVPVKPRRDGWTPARQRGFILRLALHGSVGAAARGVGRTRESAWRLRRRPGAESFAAAWDEAVGWGEDRTADLAVERSLYGEIRPHYYKGRKVGEHVRYNDSLVLAVMRRYERGPRGRGDADPAIALHEAIEALRASDPTTENKGFPR